jgi:predicted N-acetyltransferase YhbS
MDPGVHDFSGFSCGVPELDRWVRAEAVAADRQRGVVVATVNGRVVGCAQVSEFQVEAPSGVPAAVGERAVGTAIGAVLISRLAVDHGWQRRGVASALAWQVLLIASEVAVGIRARLVVARGGVDQRFCLRFGFRPLVGHLGWGYLAHPI